MICGEKYKLVKNLSGLKNKAFQFRTWIAKSLESADGKEYIIKLTNDPKKITSELRTYLYLERKGFPERYFSQLRYFDNDVKIVRNNKQIDDRFYALVLKKYDGSLEALKNSLSSTMKDKLKRKLRRRVDKLHELGVIHGDLKEANILLRINNQKRVGVLLTDFTESKFLRDEAELEKDVERENKKLRRILDRL